MGAGSRMGGGETGNGRGDVFSQTSSPPFSQTETLPPPFCPLGDCPPGPFTSPLAPPPSLRYSSAPCCLSDCSPGSKAASRVALS